MLLRLAILVLLMVAVVACIKKVPVPEKPEEISTSIVNGIPQNLSLVNAFLFACNGQHAFTRELPLEHSVYAQALFATPGSDLLVNFDRDRNTYLNFNPPSYSLSAVRFNSVLLESFMNGEAVFYTKKVIQDLAVKADWKVEGKGDFYDLQISLPRRFPSIKDSVLFDTIDSEKDLVLDVQDIVQEYDSASVLLYSASAKGAFKKRISYPNSIISITADELKALSDKSGRNWLYLSGYNYSHMIHRNKLYLFELCARRSYAVYIRKR